MTRTLSQQIKAVQKARALLNHTDRKALDACLNDAGSTLASLNLIKSLPESEQLEFLRNLKSL